MKHPTKHPTKHPDPVPVTKEPRSHPPKQMISMRMDIDVLEGLRATGRGWQSRINAAMREWLERNASADKTGGE